VRLLALWRSRCQAQAASLCMLAAIMVGAPLVGAASEAIATTPLADHSPLDVSQQLACARSVETTGDLTHAGELYRTIVAEHPDDAQGWTSYGEFLRFLVHDGVAAKKAFESALHVPHPSDQQRALALKGLGDLAFAANDAHRAIDLMRQSLALWPLAETHRALGVVLLVASHDVAGAAEQARLAVDLSPNDPLSLLVYAILCERLGRHGDGSDAYTHALSIAGCDAQGRSQHAVHCCVFYNAACYLAVCGKPEQSLTMLGAFFNAPNHLHRSRHDIETDPDFSGMRGNHDFIALLDRHLSTSGDQTAAALPPCTSCAPPMTTP
jgi:Tfp pilus assembly protein PilF